MATIGSKQFLDRAKRQFQDALNDELQVIADRIRGDLLRAGSITSMEQGLTVRQQTGQYVRQFFAEAERGGFAEDGITPQSTYARLLNQYLAKVQSDVVGAHAAYMRRALRSRPEIVVWLESAPNPVQETFVPNPLLEYDAAHTWVDPRGYRLSDRIYPMSERIRQRIDLVLVESIREGRSALDTANLIERLILPNRAKIRTQKPYGVDASFDAMRLAHTELTRAFGQATIAASAANPFVEGIDWALSARHPRIDRCDQRATIGMGGGRLKEPYPTGGVPLYPDHPMCLCTLRPSVTSTPAQTRNEIIALYERGTPAPFSVLSRAFLLSMLGSVLIGAVAGE